MKKRITLLLVLALALGMAALTGCATKAEDPGPPPPEVITPETPSTKTAAPETPSTGAAAPETAVPEAPVTETTAPDDATDGGAQEEGSVTAYKGEVLRNAVSVQIGQGSQKNWSVNMYDNAAAATMLGYLSESGLLFPTYTYDESRGFVAQNVRGSYTRNDEITVTNIKVGELYLFSGRQLRFYFKDVPGANITATELSQQSI